MEINFHTIGNKKVAEFLAKRVLVRDVQDALDIMVAAQADYIVLYEHNFGKDFFDLSTQIAGEILQKFTNYHIKMAIIGDFKKYRSKALKDFMFESNSRKEYLFVSSIEDVKKIWISL